MYHEVDPIVIIGLLNHYSQHRREDELPVNFLNPIYTEKRECQDCYKCVRHCPVKAIKVESGYASVVPELCILCGHCVEVCPNSAKRVRDDLPHARQLLATKPRVRGIAGPFLRQ